MLRVSLDGPKQIHNKNRIDLQGKNTFDIILNNLKNLRQKYQDYFKEYVSISFVISKEEDIPDIKEFFMSDKIIKDVPKICSQINNKLITNKQLKTDITKEKILKEIYDYIQFIELSNKPSTEFPFNFWWAKYLLNIYNREIIELKNKEKLINLCVPGSHRLVINPDGNYSFCIQGAESLNIGNIKEGLDINKIYTIIKNNEKILTKYCPNCWCSRFCPICPAYFTDNKNYSEDLLIKTCKDIRKNLSISFEAFLRINRKDPKLFEKIFPSEEKKIN